MTLRHVLFGTVAAFLVATSHAQGAFTIFSNIQTSPTSLIPGMGGLRFATGAGTRFDRPYGSPDGNRWMFGAQYLEGATAREVIVTGGGLTGAGASTPVFYNQVTPFDGGIAYQTFGTQMGINNSGAFAFSADTNAATTMDNTVVRWNGASYDLLAREGSQALLQPNGVGWGSLLDSVSIQTSGAVSFRTGSLTGATTQQAAYLLFGAGSGALLFQTDISSPGNQLVAPDQTIDNITTGRFRVNGVGSGSIYHGDLNGPTTTDLFVAVNGDVVAQEGVVLPGSSFVSPVLNLSGDNGSSQVSAMNGHFAFRGSNADTIDWVVVDGVVTAQTDGAIHAGATEQFDDALFGSTFFMNAVDSNGNHVTGGVTDAADVNANAVLVYNGLHVMLREGDPVDIDGNGLFDDDAFLSVFNNDDSWLSDDGYLYFNADLRNGVGTSIGQAYLWAPTTPVPEPATLVGIGLGLAILARKRRKR